MVDQSKLDRMFGMVQRLLVVTVENGATQAEAETAAARAQHISFQYNIDLAAAGAVAKGTKLDIEHKPFDLHSNHTWKRELFHGICNCNFGNGINWTGTRRAAIVAEDHNVKIIEYLYIYLERQIMALANAAWLKETRNRLYTRSAQGEGENTFKDRYGRGCATSVVNRLYGQRKASEAATAGSTALVLVKDEDIKAKFIEVYPNTRETKGTKRPAGKTSWAQGFRDGKDVALNPALQG